jgi:uncharacterized protein
MFNYITKLLVTVVIIAAAAMLFFAKSPGFPISSVVTQKDSLFTVSGEGKVTVVPDTGIISLGVNIPGKTIKQVQTDANQKINGITEKLKSMGIAAKDIETTNYYISPEYDYSQSNLNQITGYHISANLTVTTGNLI